MTLDDAVALAVANNPDIRMASLATAVAKEKLASGKTSRYPSFHIWAIESYNISGEDFEFTQGAFGEIPYIGPVPQTDVDYHLDPRWTTHVIARVVQPLSQLYRINLELDIQEKSYEIARLQEAAAAQQVTDAVRQLYYGILETQKARESLQESLKYYRQLEALVKREHSNGAVLKSAVLQVQKGLAEAGYNNLVLKNQMTGQKEQLNNLMGRPIETPFSPTPVAQGIPPLMPMEEAGKQALLQRPDLREMALKVSQAQNGIKIQKSKYFPDVSLMGMHVSSYNTAFVPRNSDSVGVMLEWDIFEWGSKKHAVAAQKNTLMQAGKNLENAKEKALIEVNRDYRALHENQALLDVKKAGQALAKENLRVTLNQYKNKKALATDVLNAQSQLAQADSQATQALMSYFGARADFEKSIGGY